MALNRRSFLKFSLIGALSSLLPVSWRGVPGAAVKQFRTEPIVPAYIVRGHADKLGSRGFVSWKVHQKSVILNEHWMARLDTDDWATRCGEQAAKTIDEVAIKILTKGSSCLYSKLGV